MGGRRRIGTVAVAVGSVLSLAACGSSGGGTTSGSGPLRIMVEGAFGAQATLSVNADMGKMAVEAAVAEINAAGGIDGRKIQADYADDGGNATTAITKLQSAINSGNKPFAYFITGPSNTAAAVLPVLKQQKILTFNEAPTGDSTDPSKFPLNFDVTPSPINSATAFCPYAKKQGYSRVAILYADDAYAAPASSATKTTCESSGSTVTGTAKFEDTTLDLTPQLEQLRATKPQALVMIGYGAPVGYALKDRATLGWNVPVFGDLAVAASQAVNSKPPTGNVGTSLVDGVSIETYASSVQGASGQPANTAQMIKEIKKFGAIKTSLFLAYQYDGVQLLAAAAKRAGTTTDVEKVAKALIGLPAGAARTGVLKGYYYTASSHAPNQPASAYAFAKPSVPVDGQFEAASG